MAKEGPLEPLVITEEGDLTEDVAEGGGTWGRAIIKLKLSGQPALKKEEGHPGEDKYEEDALSKMRLEEESPGKLRTGTEDDHGGEVDVDEADKQEDDEREENENMNDGQNGSDSNGEGQMGEVMGINEKPAKPSDTEDEEVTRDDLKLDIKRVDSPGQQPEGTESPEEDSKKVCKLLINFSFASCPEVTSNS